MIAGQTLVVTGASGSLSASQVLAATRQRLPRTVLILAMHELPADTSVLGPDWTAIPLDQDQWALSREATVRSA